MRGGATAACGRIRFRTGRHRAHRRAATTAAGRDAATTACAALAMGSWPLALGWQAPRVGARLLGRAAAERGVCAGELGDGGQRVGLSPGLLAPCRRPADGRRSGSAANAAGTCRRATARAASGSGRGQSATAAVASTGGDRVTQAAATTAQRVRAATAGSRLLLGWRLLALGPWPARVDPRTLGGATRVHGLGAGPVGAGCDGLALHRGALGARRAPLNPGVAARQRERLEVVLHGAQAGLLRNGRKRGRPLRSRMAQASSRCRRGTAWRAPRRSKTGACTSPMLSHTPTLK